MLGIMNITALPALSLCFSPLCVCVCIFCVFAVFLFTSRLLLCLDLFASPVCPPSFCTPAPFNRQLTCSKASAVALGRNTCKKMAETCSRLWGAATPTRLQLAARKTGSRRQRESESERVQLKGFVTGQVESNWVATARHMRRMSDAGEAQPKRNEHENVARAFPQQFPLRVS